MLEVFQIVGALLAGVYNGLLAWEAWLDQRLAGTGRMTRVVMSTATSAFLLGYAAHRIAT